MPGKPPSIKFLSIAWPILCGSLAAPITAIAFGLILINFLESQIKEVTILMVKSPGKSLLMGIVFLIIIPLAAFLLFITLIGIPLATIILGLYFLLLYLLEMLHIVRGRWMF